MVIQNIKIKNYRQYRDEINVDLNTTDDRNINIILGETGTGKTNFSSAIQWCLYGEEYSDKNSEFGLLNLNTFEELEDGEKAGVKVELTLETNEGELYTVSRTQTVVKKDNKQELIGAYGGNLKAIFHRTEKVIPTYDDKYPDDLINNLAPKKIKEYFFFDGERLERYFRSSSADKIKDSIFQISQLDLLESVVKNLEIIIKDYRREVSAVNPHTEELNRNITDEEREIEENNAKLIEKENTLKDMKDKRNDYMDNFMRLGGDETKEIIERNRQIDEILPLQLGKLNEKEDEKRILLMSNSYLFIANSCFNEATRIFQEAEEKKIIPPDINPVFIEKLLRDGKCICGTDISQKNQGSRKMLSNYLDVITNMVGNSDPMRLVEIEQDISNILQNHIPATIKEIKLLNDPIKMLSSKISDLKREKENNNAKLINNTTLDNIANVRIKIDQLDYEIEKIGREIYSIKEEIKEKEQNISTLEDERRSETQKSDRNAHYTSCMDFCNKAKEDAIKIKEKIMNEIRNEISVKTEQYYKELHWKKNENIQIKIDEDYRIVALQNGRNKFGAFSAGENALLAMSFIFALNRESGFNVPLVLDTALGRISPEPKANWAKNLSKYLNDTQVILLFTGSEYSDEVQKNLAPSVATQYKIYSEKSPYDQAHFEKI